MGLKESGLRGSLRSVSTGVGAIPDSVEYYFDAKNIDATDSDTVQNWEDEVTGQSVTGEATYRDDGINGNAALKFDGNDDSFINTDFSNIQDATVIAVVEIIDDSSDNFLTGRVDSVSPAIQWFDGLWTPIIEETGNDGSTDSSVQLVSFRMESGDWIWRENGDTIVSGTGSANAFEAMAIGFEAENDRRYWDGYVGLVEVHEAGLSVSEISNRENELANEWGISL